MLSRVAERIYWLGRYVERAENTARLVGVNASLLLDLPRAVNLVWSGLIEVVDSVEHFHERYEKAEERNVVRYMLVDEKNFGSLIRSLYMARENARTTREMLPSEVWEQINELYWYVKEHVDHALARRHRQDFLEEVILGCHQLTGMFLGTLSHDSTYQFIRMGRSLERADMTTRILDAGSANLLLKKEELPEHFETMLWMNILRSLSAFQMYRQHVLDRVNAEDVIDFLLKDELFPRSVTNCLIQLSESFQQLPGNENPLRSAAHVRRVAAELDAAKVMEEGLRSFIDTLQRDLADIHTEIENTWFRIGDDTLDSA